MSFCFEKRRKKKICQNRVVNRIKDLDVEESKAERKSGPIYSNFASYCNNSFSI